MPKMSYPFTALVAQDDLKLALKLLAVQPRLGGVLIRGDKGAAKSTAARGLAELLPAVEGRAAPFVNLPLGATEDRVVGTLDLERALRGERKLLPGLLAEADGGVLYVDEVNLLADHLVDVLLDAAALGVTYVQREGLSVEQATHFALVGTMNPEEGKLRPQFLDRFGLCVEVTTPDDLQARTGIVRRRLRFEADAEAFRLEWQAEQQRLKEELTRARATCPTVQIDDAMLTAASKLCQRGGVRSLRADLVLTRAAQAYAALCGAATVTPEHIERVAPLVLTHRRSDLTPPRPRQSPPDLPSVQDLLDDKSDNSPDDADSSPDPSDGETNAGGSSPNPTNEQHFSIGTPSAPVDFDLPPASLAGRRNKTDAPRGRATRPVKSATPGRLAVSESVLHAAERGGAAGFVKLERDDLHGYHYEQKSGTRLLLIVDSSGSLAARKRMERVKGAVAALLNDADAKRDQVCIVAFRGTQAECVLPWTRDSEDALATLEALPTGGRTPLAHALQVSQRQLESSDAGFTVLFTDGKANVPLQAGADVWEEVLGVARTLAHPPSMIVDTEEGAVRLGRARELAEAVGARYVLLDDLERDPPPLSTAANTGKGL